MRCLQGASAQPIGMFPPAQLRNLRASASNGSLRLARNWQPTLAAPERLVVIRNTRSVSCRANHNTDHQSRQHEREQGRSSSIVTLGLGACSALFLAAASAPKALADGRTTEAVSDWTWAQIGDNVLVFLIFYCIVRVASNLFEDSDTLQTQARKQRDLAVSRVQGHRDRTTRSYLNVGKSNVHNATLARNAARRLMVAIKASQPLINQLVHDITHGAVQAATTCTTPAISKTPLVAPDATDSTAALVDIDSLTELVQQQMCRLLKERQSSQPGNLSPEEEGTIQGQLAALVAEAAALQEIRSLVELAHVVSIKGTAAMTRS